MHQSSRLAHPQGNVGRGAGHRPAAAPASVPPPSTPRKNGEGLNNLIRSLEQRYQWDLKINSKYRSPAQLHTTEDAVTSRIQRLYYSTGSALHDALEAFANTAKSLEKHQRLHVLLKILKSKGQHESPVSRTGTPMSARNVPPKSLPTPQTPQRSTKDTPRSRGLFDNYRQDEEASLRAAIPDPGSPTDDDEDEFVTPPSPRASSRSPSPSVASISAKRRVQASAHLSLHATARKRPSDGSNEPEKLPKLTKISKGKQPFDRPQVPAVSKPSPPRFKKPSLNMARSINAPTASQSTANTSFNTVSSSQQTQPDTANTSFTSDADHTEVPYSFMKRTSSTTTGLLDDHDLLSVNAKFAKEAIALESHAEPSNSASQGRDSSSTWGSSIPEEDLLDASARVELMHALSPECRRLSPQQPAQRLGRSQPVHSPVKNEYFNHPRGSETSLNQSFPPPPEVSVKLSPAKPILHRQSPASDLSPVRPQQQPSREQTPAKSPSKISCRIQDIRTQGLCVKDIEVQWQDIPYHVLFICQRVSLDWSVSLQDLLRDIDVRSSMSDPETFWFSLHSHPKARHIKSKETDRLWSATRRGMNAFTFKGHINLSNNRFGPVFNLELHPIQPDKSCRFQRHFGSDRFLYLNLPKLDFSNNFRFNKDEELLIKKAWNDWLHTEHSFLGRKWRAFHIGPIKRAKSKGEKKTAMHDMRIVLFATKGYSIEEPCTIGEMLNWFFPFARNQKQSFCKAFARIDLGLSKTTPALGFKPSQVIRVRDILANGESEAVEYNDPTLHWKDVPYGQVMNDGCSLVSVGAAHKIWKYLKDATGVSGPLPSAFQGRIGGAKGMWMISAESYTKDPEHLDIWIKISDSQLKFESHEADLCDDIFDPHRLTFEVSNYSSSPAHSELHISFIGIMADRGVERDVIADSMIERLNADRAELLDKVTDPVKMYDYVHRNSASSDAGVDMQWQAGLPSLLKEKIKLLLESGFSPIKLQYLAKSVERFIKAQHNSQESSLRAPLGKATYLFGIADPIGVLQPGEIHVRFSTPFVDEMTGETYSSLKCHDILVARQPACRRSDIQKVRAIDHPDLSHLIDVVVFPSRGRYPLAGKLQGGDYDGDNFWLCWEDKLVRPFKNAPAPVESPDPACYGIRQDKRKLSDVMNPQDVSNVDGFLRESFLFRVNKSLLGTATVFLENHAYYKNKIHSYELDRICDMHDLLVDAPKQGYIFTNADFELYIQKTLRLKFPLPLPAYKAAMEKRKNTKEMGDMDKILKEPGEHEKNNVIDYLYFEVLRAHNVATMRKIQDILSTATGADPDLLHPRRRLDDYKDKTIDEELRRTQEEVDKIYQSWRNGLRTGHTTEEYARLVEDCHRRFLAIKPQNTDHPLIRPWVECYRVPGQCLWDTLRAATLYAKLTQPKASTFVFMMAGNELTRLKADCSPQTRAMVANIRANMKPKPIKALANADNDDEDESELASLIEGEVS
ncbi:uncharacterized protein EKO05_0007083 [Ascochyta rabiei]|uniref:RNA-dependent RNA polymerase n=1 Tax=Didymella rabiei TaxID=5454 RepID=A0A163G3G3_DIDRA|nr:uncharacterized protein EKO05_0007083 [Ascochyta rabiei]KZM24659.1 RNA-directed RNA polymerase [Ascochyta rabiei]UPX16695.1 hypothetical protein EKO05_0007083 [Ascochyta rabiei]